MAGAQAVLRRSNSQMSKSPVRRGRQANVQPKTPDKSTSPVPSPGSWNVQRGRSRQRRPSNTFTEDNLRRRGYHALHSSFGKVFHVEKRWKLIREMGSGAYGVVISAADDISGETVAIKLVNRVFDKIQLAKRALREITLLRHFGNHENITGLIDVDAISPDFNEIYIFMEPMEADLHQIIKSGQILTNEHVQYFLYQILRGMKYIHSASVIHRDLKPGNLLVNADCELKICDFGLSRGFDARPDEDVTHLTEYVATRWYRAPEIMLAFQRYNTAIDVWSIGCIFAELLLGRPLFKGKDYVDQLNKVLDVLGSPDESIIKRIGSEKAQAYVRSLPLKIPVPFHKLIPSADPIALDLLSKMLKFDPTTRISVSDALAHPWLATYHDVSDEPECPTPFEKWRVFEQLETLDQFRAALWNEIEEYRKEVRGLDTSVEDEVIPPPERKLSLSGATSVFLPDDEEDEEEQPECAVDSGISMGSSSENEAVGKTKGKSLSPVKQRRETGALAPPSPLLARRPTDPVVTYARRSSILPSRRGSTFSSPHPGMPVPLQDGPLNAESTYIAFPTQTQGFVMPARSRTASMAGGEVARRLLRTLSTVSIHESVEGLPIRNFIMDRQTTGADAPASEMPQEFGGIAEERGEGSGSGGRKFVLG